MVLEGRAARVVRSMQAQQRIALLCAAGGGGSAGEVDGAADDGSADALPARR